MAGRGESTLLGRIALHNKLITQDQLAEATRERGEGSKNIGDILVEKGWINPAQLKKLVVKQKELVAKHRAAQAAERAAPEPEAVPATPASAPAGVGAGAAGVAH